MMDMDGLEFYLVYSGAEEKKVLGICEKVGYFGCIIIEIHRYIEDCRCSKSEGIYCLSISTYNG